MIYLYTSFIKFDEFFTFAHAGWRFEFHFTLVELPSVLINTASLQVIPTLCFGYPVYFDWEYLLIFHLVNLFLFSCFIAVVFFYCKFLLFRSISCRYSQSSFSVHFYFLNLRSVCYKIFLLLFGHKARTTQALHKIISYILCSLYMNTYETITFSCNNEFRTKCVLCWSAAINIIGPQIPSTLFLAG